ncbi:MAG: hypothetical protein Q4C87_00550 [Actinomycetaceae bacterium]|nr:hypothetical protein [Actinomycetaceae bacterium]
MSAEDPASRGHQVSPSPHTAGRWGLERKTPEERPTWMGRVRKFGSPLAIEGVAVLGLGAAAVIFVTNSFGILHGDTPAPGAQSAQSGHAVVPRAVGSPDRFTGAEKEISPADADEMPIQGPGGIFEGGADSPRAGVPFPVPPRSSEAPKASETAATPSAPAAPQRPGQSPAASSSSTSTHSSSHSSESSWSSHSSSSSSTENFSVEVPIPAPPAEVAPDPLPQPPADPPAPPVPTPDPDGSGDQEDAPGGGDDPVVPLDVDQGQSDY